MKHLRTPLRPVLAALAASLLFTVACAAKASQPQEVTVAIEGMTCEGCVQAITETLQGAPGVLEARVTLEPPQAVVRFDPDRTAPALLTQAIDALGYRSYVAAPPAAPSSP